MARNVSGYLRQSFDYIQALAAGLESLLQWALAPWRPQAKPSQAASPGFAQMEVEPVRLARAPIQVKRHHPVLSETGPAWAELMARISHDLRTPLNAVIGFSDVMKSELLGPVGHPRYREYVGDIRDCGQKLLKATEDTLAITALLAATQPGHTPRPIRLTSLSREAWDFCTSLAAERNIQMRLDCDAGLEILCDLRPMRQVLVNLMTEAIHRTVDGGEVRLEAFDEGDGVRIEVSAMDDARQDQTETGASLPVSLARALLELQGAGLLEIPRASGGWTAVTYVERVSQPDFFAVSSSIEWRPAPALC